MLPRRLYMDNAATSFPKPAAVTDAMVRFAREVGASAGRGAYAEAAAAGAVVADCRRAVNRLLNGADADHVIFTLNGTDALNLAIHGLVPPSGGKAHAICTDLDHNSVLRPLAALADDGRLDVTRVAADPTSGRIDPADVRRAVRPQTRLIVLPHASNVTGAVQPVAEVGRIARECGVPLVVDAAQTAGHVPIDVQADHVDLLAAPGHKGLLGPLGTGVLYVRPGLERMLRPTREGGTGSASEHDRQPEAMPDRYEAGSLNAIGIAGLLEGVRYVLGRTVEALAAHDLDLVRTFIDGVGDVDGLTYVGPQGVRHRLGLFGVRIDGYDPHEVSAILEGQFGILTRSGLHCAPRAHAGLGTLADGGTTRLSFGPFLSKQDVKFATDALGEVAASRPAAAVG